MRLRMEWMRTRLQNRAGWAGGKTETVSHFHTLLLLRRRAVLCVTKNTPESWNGENRISPVSVNTEEATRQSFVSEYTYFLLGSFLAAGPTTSKSLPLPDKARQMSLLKEMSWGNLWKCLSNSSFFVWRRQRPGRGRGRGGRLAALCARVRIITKLSFSVLASRQ